MKTRIREALERGDYLDIGEITFVSHDKAIGNNYIGRHAEEFLCDVADDLNQQGNFTFYIYGKRRPCITCAARMQVTGILHYNRNHGRLFRHTTNHMTDDQTREVIRMLIEESSHITQRTVDVVGRNVAPYLTTHYPSAVSYYTSPSPRDRG